MRTASTSRSIPRTVDTVILSADSDLIHFCRHHILHTLAPWLCCSFLHLHSIHTHILGLVGLHIHPACNNSLIRHFSYSKCEVYTLKYVEHSCNRRWRYRYNIYITPPSCFLSYSFTLKLPRSLCPQSLPRLFQILAGAQGRRWEPQKRRRQRVSRSCPFPVAEGGRPSPANANRAQTVKHWKKQNQRRATFFFFLSGFALGSG